MRRQRRRIRGWVSIPLALFLCVAVYMYGSMGFAQAAYSPTENGQEGLLAPGKDERGSCRETAFHGGMTPAQPAELMQEGVSNQLHPAQEHRQPGLTATACHAVRVLMFSRPLSELASRTGGHAPP